MRLADLTWPDVPALRKDTPVVFPVAVLEQHGRHMPLYTALKTTLKGRNQRRSLGHAP
jgi:creatinine amidohydrolase/Fe(II)-dependent formamide hydrolase-like protein